MADFGKRRRRIYRPAKRSPPKFGFSGFLGKTLQVIALLSGLWRQKVLRNVLIIVPATLQKQWVQEFDKWWPLIRVKILTGRKIKPETVYICSYERARIQARETFLCLDFGTGLPRDIFS